MTGKLRLTIVVAVYKPNPDKLISLLESIRLQTIEQWNCHLYFDSTPDPIVLSYISKDSRFSVRESVHTLGIYDNFMTALAENIPNSDLIFFSDQDDLWRKDKIQKFLDTFLRDENCSLIFSDARVLRKSDVIAKSLMKYEKRRPPLHWHDLIIRNSISGTTMAVRTRLLPNPFPYPTSGGWFHDLWIALVCLTRGGIVYLPDALIDYIQHDDNAFGARKFNFLSELKLFSWRRLNMNFVIKQHLYEVFIQNCHTETITRGFFQDIILHSCRTVKRSDRFQLALGLLVHKIKVTFF